MKRTPDINHLWLSKLIKLCPHVAWLTYSYYHYSKEQKEQIKKQTGKLGNGMGENLLGFEDSEDEDYEAEATKRVNEAITSILVEEEGEMLEQAAYVPPEK